MNRIPKSSAVLFLVVAWFALPSTAHAQISYGVRAGVSASPDQFYFGGHVESPGLTQSGHLALRPNVELGFGSDVTHLAGNLEIVYWAPFPNSTWTPYFGGGPGVAYRHSDTEDRAHGVFNGLVGFQHKSGIFTEMKIGSGVGPGLKVSVGYVIKKGK